MDDHQLDTMVKALGELTQSIHAVRTEIHTGFSELCEIFRENQPGSMPKCTPMPDVVPYGEWEIPPLEGVWGKGTSWKKIGWLGHFNNFNPKTKAPTSIYHEFTKWLLSLPRNRNFWMTGNSVEYFTDGRLIKVAESVFRCTHTDVIKTRSL